MFYNTFKKTENMERMDRGIPDMNKTTQRGNFQSIYRKESAPSYYDSVKVADKHKELVTNKKNSMVDFKKQTKRNYDAMLHGTEFYRNVQRDNERQDYIKKLLESK